MIPVLSPIRFYDPNLSYANSTTFQNPDNRVSTGYIMNGVSSLFSATPVPRQWPDGQPGIDFLINSSSVYAHLYDADDEYYATLTGRAWASGVTRFTLNGNDGDGIEDGYYTIKIILTSNDAVLYESEAIIMAEWFDGMIPFEYWNFENDFGMEYISSAYEDELKYTGRMLVPIRMFDPTPEFEKEVYKNDPGVLTTLRSTVQRVFNFESDPVPTYTAEQFALAFANSELYLDRIKINSEEAPEAELIEGTNQKILTGKATLVNFHDSYERERVDTELYDMGKDWSVETYANGSISGDTLTVNDISLGSDSHAYSEVITYSDDDVFLIELVLTGNVASRPYVSISNDTDLYRVQNMGTNWISYRCSGSGAFQFYVKHYAGAQVQLTAKLTVYKVRQPVYPA